jgi:hypothetical protein
LERVKQSLQQSPLLAARDVCLGILGATQQFMRAAPLHNDVTALALVRTDSRHLSPGG